MASIYSFFLHVQNIPSRLVTLEGKINEVYRAGHVFNEIYLKDQQQWVFSDLTSGAILVRNQKGTYLNTLDFYQAYKDDFKYEFTGMDTAAGNKHLESFYDYYFQSNNNIVFYFKDQFSTDTYDFKTKLKRYLFPRPTFAVYGGNSAGDNFKFHIKQFAFLLLILFIVYWIISTILTAIGRRRQVPTKDVDNLPIRNL